MKEIAIMGGTFDPIHIGHLIGAQWVYDTGRFDEIWFMPTANPPHKDVTPHEPTHRLKMCKEAIKGFDHFKLSDFEYKRSGRVYTADTFRLLNEEVSDTRFWLIIGTDSLINLTKWYEAAWVLEHVPFVIIPRGGYEVDQSIPLVKDYEITYGANMMLVDMPQIEVSSSIIRQRIQAQQLIDFLVPDGVKDYIQKHGLYRL